MGFLDPRPGEKITDFLLAAWAISPCRSRGAAAEVLAWRQRRAARAGAGQREGERLAERCRFAAANLSTRPPARLARVRQGPSRSAQGRRGRAGEILRGEAALAHRLRRLDPATLARAAACW